MSGSKARRLGGTLLLVRAHVHRGNGSNGGWSPGDRHDNPAVDGRDAAASADRGVGGLDHDDHIDTAKFGFALVVRTSFTAAIWALVFGLVSISAVLLFLFYDRKRSFRALRRIGRRGPVAPRDGGVADSRG